MDGKVIYWRKSLATSSKASWRDAPAMYWTRFQTAQMWGEIAMKQFVGGPISPAKLAQVRASAVAACDAETVETRQECPGESPK